VLAKGIRGVPAQGCGFGCLGDCSHGSYCKDSHLEVQIQLDHLYKGKCVSYRGLVPMTVWRAGRLWSGSRGRYRIAVRDV